MSVRGGVDSLGLTKKDFRVRGGGEGMIIREEWLIQFEGQSTTLIAYSESEAQEFLSMFPGGYVYDYRQIDRAD